MFVYGTLRAGEANAGLLDGYVAERIPAALTDHDLHHLEHPCVTPSSRSRPERRSRPVQGELVVLGTGAYHDAIMNLDWLESFDPADVAGSLYRRVAATAQSRDGPVACWVYVAGDTLRARLEPSNRIVSGDWLNP